jgi:hypothetical protein
MVWLIKTNPFVPESINIYKKYIYLFIDWLHKTIIYFPPIKYRRSSSVRLISSPKKKIFLGVFISRQVIVFCLLYFFYIIIIILLFYDLIKIRIMSRMKIFGTSIAGFIIIVARNKNNKKNNSLVLFHDLLGI